MKMRHLVALIVLVCATLLSSHPALAQFSQQGPKLVGTDPAFQGRSVSLSADGNTAIVGGLGDNSGAGAAWVWTRSAGVWTQQGTKLVGSDAVGIAHQGLSVSLSADGNTAIVGGSHDSSYAGAAWVWTRTAGVWTQQGTKLVGSGAVGGLYGVYQGRSVSLSADGNRAIAGGPSDNSGVGAAWVWTKSGGVWNQQGTKLVGAGALANADQGFSVSLSADGNTAIVGGPYDNGVGVNNAGAAWVFAVPTICDGLRPTAVVSGTAALCGAGSTPIQAVLTGTGPWNVTWSDSVVQSGVATSPATRNVSPSSTTTYTVTALTDANCTAQAGDLTGSAVVTVGTTPATPSPTNNGPTCVGGSVQLSVGIVTGAAYAWTGPNGFTSTQALPTLSNVTTTMAGGYFVTVTVSGCTSAPGTTNAVVNAIPATPVIAAPASTVAGTTGLTASVVSHAGSSWFWTIGNGTITAGQGTSQITFTAGAAGTPLTLSVTETNASGCLSAPGNATVTVTPASSTNVFFTLPPCRVLDTRNPTGLLGAPALQPGATRVFDIAASSCGIPVGALAISANMTVTNVGALGELVVFPSDISRPNTSALSFRTGRTRANNAIVSFSKTSATFSVFNNSPSTVDFILDVNGYFR